MADLRSLFDTKEPVLIGMVHVDALAGTPSATESIDVIAARAASEARQLMEAGFDGLIIENMHDRPYLRRNVGPEIVAGMTRVGVEVQRAIAGRVMPLGVQILAGANSEAMAVALAVGASFIRAEGFVFASIADEGLLDEADAGPLLRYRRQIGAGSIGVLCDIKKKHASHAVTADLDIAATAKAAEFFGADGVVVTGKSTGESANLEEVAAARASTSLPLFVGSGVTPETIPDLVHARVDGLIVGSWFKKRGQWFNGPDPDRMRELVGAFRAAVSSSAR